MIIDLPAKFRYSTSISDFAEVKNGILHIHGNVAFKKIMYELTFALKGKHTCHYCKKRIKSNKVTLDHMYPLYIGGPTIPNNLIPCCGKCNSTKGNLTAEQFITYNKLPNGERERYRKVVYLQQKYVKIGQGLELPSEWVSWRNLDNILVSFDLTKPYKGKQYDHISEYYNLYKSVQKPLIVDQYGFLLDGYITLMFAKNEGLTNLPLIVLENVITHPIPFVK